MIPFDGTIGIVIVALAAILLVLLAILGYRIWQASRIRPAERERRRRAALAAGGKVTDASIVDYHDGHLFYSYLVRGVEYTASQDVSSLSPLVPNDLTTIGTVWAKYDARNPANSIVIAENWMGLRPK